MTRGVSLYLDFLRVAATLIVVMSHWAYPRFTGTTYGYLRDWNVGSDAVIVFFVMSGCVIAYAADRDGGAGRFAFNRITRLMSVMIPALILTLLFDAMGTRIDMAAYPDKFYHPQPLGEFLLRGLTFTNQWSGFDRLRLGTNGPLWSLSYEAAYYIMFGLIVFLKGPARIASVLAVAVFAGLNILLLMPAWVMGVMVWRWLREGRAALANPAMGWALMLAGPVLYLVCQSVDLPNLLKMYTAQALGVPDARWVFGFSDEFIWNAMIGAFTVAHVAGIAILNPQGLPAARAVRWLAGASFSVYVTHYPALHLLDAMLPQMAGRDALLLTGSIVVGIAFASVFERPIKSIRGWFMGGWRLYNARRTEQTT